MEKKINTAVRTVPATPRSKRLRARGVAVGTIVRGGGSAPAAGASAGNAGASSGSGHSHDNKADLDALSLDGHYLQVRDYEVDKTDPTVFQAVDVRISAGYADKAAEADKAKTAEAATMADKAKELTPDSPTRKDFLSKEHDDVSNVYYQFCNGIGVGEDDNGDATFTADINGNTAAVSYTVGDFIAGLQGGRFWVDELGRTHLQVDDLTALGKLSVRSIEAQEVRHIGGAQLISPGGGRCSRVAAISRGYRCYFDSTDGDRIIHNTFAVGDLVLCQTFNLDSGTRYYHRRVDAIGADDKSFYIDLSDEVKVQGSDAPAAGDSIVVMGNDTDHERQSAIMLAAAGPGAPFIAQYIGLNSFANGINKIGTLISPEQNIFRGSFYVEAGDVASLLATLRVDADRIFAGLGSTGINITDGIITLDADRVLFRDSDGTTAGMFNDGKFLARLIDVENLVARHVLAGEAGGRRVEIDPDSKSVQIADADGIVRTVLCGDSYSSADDIFGTAAGGAVTLSAPAPTVGKTVTLGTFTTDAPCLLRFSAGELSISAACAHLGEKITSLPYATARVAVTVDTYTDSTKAVLVASSTLAAFSAEAKGNPGAALTDGRLAGRSVRIPRAGYCVISLTRYESTNPAADGCSTAVTWANAPQAAYDCDLYGSTYFANGFCLGSNRGNHAIVFNDAGGRINAIIRNDSNGIRLTPAGLEVCHHGGKWQSVPRELLCGYFAPSDAVSVPVYGGRTFDGAQLTASRFDVGEYRIAIPSTWRAKGVNVDNSNTCVCVTPRGKGTTASADVSSTILTVYTSRDGVPADVSFHLTFSIL